MWSASSSTVTWMSDNVQACRSSRSMSRPGVATTMSASRTRVICLPIGTPP